MQELRNIPIYQFHWKGPSWAAHATNCGSGDVSTHHCVRKFAGQCHVALYILIAPFIMSYKLLRANVNDIWTSISSLRCLIY